MNKYDYMILETGYTSRIPEQLGNKLVVKKINSVIKYGFNDGETHKNNHLVCIKDDLWGKYNNCAFVLYGKKEDFDFVNSIVKTDGYVLLKNVDVKSMFSLIDYFNEEINRYCTGCCSSHVYTMDLHTTIDNKTILHVKVHAESG